MRISVQGRYGSSRSETGARRLFTAPALFLALGVVLALPRFGATLKGSTVATTWPVRAIPFDICVEGDPKPPNECVAAGIGILTGTNVYFTPDEAARIRIVIRSFCAEVGDTVRLVPRRYTTPNGIREREGAYILFEKERSKTYGYADGAGYSGDKAHGIWLPSQTFVVPKPLPSGATGTEGMRRTILHEWLRAGIRA